MPVLRNKRTGETIIVPDAPQQVQAPNPLSVRGAQAGVAGQEAGAARTRGQEARDAALFELTRRKLKAEADKAAADAVAAQDVARGIVRPDSARRGVLSDRQTALRNLESVLSDLEGQYNKNFKGQSAKRGFGLGELLPEWASSTNQKFNSTALRAGPFIQSILGLGSKEADAAAEYEKKVMPFIPRAGGIGSGLVPSPEYDETTESKLRMMNDFLNSQRASTARGLGQRPSAPRRSGLDVRPAARKPGSKSREINFNDLPE